MKAEDARERLRHEDPDLPPPGHLYEAPDRLMERMRRFTSRRNHDIRPHGHANVIEFSVAPSRQYQGSIEEVRKDIRSAADDGGSSFIACDNKGQVDRLNELLEETEGLYSIGTTRLSGGFVSRETGICLFTDHEIFSRYRRRVRYRRFKDGVPVPDWRSLTLGDLWYTSITASAGIWASDASRPVMWRTTVCSFSTRAPTNYSFRSINSSGSSAIPPRRVWYRSSPVSAARHGKHSRPVRRNPSGGWPKIFSDFTRSGSPSPVMRFSGRGDAARARRVIRL